MASTHFKSWPIFAAPAQRGLVDSGCEPVPGAAETTAAVSGSQVWTTARSRYDHTHVPATMTRAQPAVARASTDSYIDKARFGGEM